MLRPILGYLLIATGVLGLVLSLAGLLVLPGVVDGVAADLDTVLAETGAQVGVVQETLRLTKDTLAEIGQTLDTVERAAMDASTGMSQTSVLIDELGQLTGQSVPNSLDVATGILPSFSDLARTVDGALSALADFKVDTQILGFPIQFDLGLNYDSTEPLDRPLVAFGESLDNLANDLRGQTATLAGARQSVDLVSQDMAALAEDLDEINQRLAEFAPLLDQYEAMADGIRSRLGQAQENLAANLRLVKAGSVLLCLWLALVQLAPLYLGWELASQRRPGTAG